MNHTPGPWIQCLSCKDAFQPAIEKTGRNDVICVMDGEYTPEQEANACLIAAAPDMLAMLETIADMLDMDFEDIDYGYAVRDADWWKALPSLIAKAKGEST